MRNVPKFQDVAAEFGDRADFYFVYITEAHPSDGWSFGKPAPAQQTTMEARVSTAEEWHAGLSDRSVPLLVDPIDDRVNDAFSARPERLYILKGDEVAFKGGEGPFAYSMDDMTAALKKLL